MKTLPLILLILLSCCQKKKEAVPVPVMETPMIKEVPVQRLFMESARFNGQKVIVTGKLLREEGMAPDMLILIQYMAFHPGESEEQELKVKVKYAGATELPFNSWIRVQGTVRGVMPGMTVEAESLTVIPKPQSWLHPDLTHQHQH